jgi:glycosyltransferase involved in cell wall biosynthesis
MKLSVVIITFNEEKNIARCLDSVQNIADEIVVVDSFSTDATPLICKKYDVKFIQHPFNGYGEQKNIALQHAAYNYVLSLDADENPDEKLLNAIAHEKASGFSADGYTMNRCTNYCGKWIRHGDWYPDAKLRLFNKHKLQWNNALIHESVAVPTNTSIHHLKGDILHYSYHSIEEHVIQNNKFSSASAEELFARGKHTNLLKLIFNPWWAFMRSYFIRLGLLDGFYGLVVAVNISHLTFLKHCKLYQKQKSA